MSAQDIQQVSLLQIRPFPLETFPAPHPLVIFAPGLSLTKTQLMSFRPFQEWTSRLVHSFSRQKFSDHNFKEHPYTLHEIHVQAADIFNGTVYFVKLWCKVTNDQGQELPGVVFLRGGSVAVLMILRPSDRPDERWVVMTEQARIAAGSLSFREIPAGRIDDHDNFAGSAARQIEAEIGISLKSSQLIDMTKMVTERNENFSNRLPENLRNAIYPSPGGCDEFMNIFLWEKEMDRVEIEARKVGDRAMREGIAIRLLPYERLLEEGGRDGKTLIAWSLYEYLKSAEMID